MAKKTTAKQNTNNGESKFKGIRNFFTSERTRFITGLVISIVTIYVGLALISFFFTGGADQSKIENIPLSDLVINRGSVENWTGVRGAFLADLLMNRWFGISSFLILLFLGSVGAKLMNLSRVSLLKRFLFSAAMLIWGSLFFAFIFIRGYEDTFIYLGGQHGYYLSEVMMNNIGIPGTVLLLVGLFLIVAIFTSKRTIPFLQNVFSFGWLKNRLKRDKSETTEVPEEEEDVEGEAEVYAPVEKTVAAPQPVAYRETVEENIGPDEYVFDTETEMRKAEVETEVPQKDDFEFEVARGDDPVVEAGNGNNTIFEVEVPEEEEEFDQSQLGKYDPRLDLSRYMSPTLDLLKFYDSGNVEVNREELEENQQMIKRTLEDFGINIASIKATVGPTVTLYEIIPEEKLYERTGIQKQIFNTIYQLMAVKSNNPEILEHAETMLMIPEYFNYLLTGEKASEYTNATTTQLVSPETKDWDYELIEMLGYPKQIFQKIKKPGTVLGNLTKEIQKEVGFDCEVVLPATHDTGSAVMAVPTNEDNTIYISSGTWSLMGTELKKADCSPESRLHNFTNEGGYEYRFRYLKNIMGLWMIQSVRKELAPKQGFGEICEAAARADIASLVDCNDDRFLAPQSMTEEVQKACAETGQRIPEGIAETACVIYNSLAQCYAQTIREIEEMSEITYESIHVVGGGANAAYLNELTAKATGKTVYAGPTEATAIGNLTAQIIAAGELENLQAARKCIFESFEIKKYEK